MKKFTRKHVLVFGLTAGLLMPAAVAEAVFCSRILVGVRLSDAGRLEIRTKDAASGGNTMLAALCSVKIKMGTIEPDTCSHLYSQLLAAFHTGATVSIQFREAKLDQDGLWDGACDKLTHHGDFSSAIATIENQ